MSAPKANMSPAQIKAALEAGIISTQQANAMGSLFMGSLFKAEKNNTEASIGDEENLRFFRSFSDIFIGFGISLFTLGLWFVFDLAGGGAFYLFGAALMCLGAEYFALRKRAHLPTLILALFFLLFTHKCAGDYFSGVSASSLTLIATAIFYARYRLPFCLALIAVSAVMLASALAPNSPTWVYTLSGLILFIIAIAYDAHDPERVRRFSDNAFWLHFVAAPLFIHGVAAKALKVKTQILFGVLPVPDITKADAAIGLGVMAIVTLIGLAINRRALIASCLIYAGLAIGYLVKDTGLTAAGLTSTSLLVLGAGIIFLGVGWHTARRGLLMVLPKNGIWGQIFPPAKGAAKSP